MSGQTLTPEERLLLSILDGFGRIATEEEILEVFDQALEDAGGDAVAALRSRMQ